MNNRRIGLIVVLVGLLVAIGLPAAIGRTISGTAQAVSVPGPPRVGDCVGRRFDVDRYLVTSDPAKYGYPELVPGACSRAHYGEVTFVIAQPAAVKVEEIPGGDGYSIQDENVDACRSAAGAYLGRDASEPGVLFGFWSAGLYPPFIPMTPNALQRATGQHWLACTVYLTNQSDVDARSMVGYEGSVRNAWSTGVGRDYLGACPDEADWKEMTSIDCLQPHHGEVFGITGLPRDVPRRVLTASCAKLVAQITRTDVMRTGQLTVDVQATDNDGRTVTGATVPRNTTVQCGVLTSGHHLLKGSLLAIGNEPIPWA